MEPHDMSLFVAKLVLTLALAIAPLLHVGTPSAAATAPVSGPITTQDTPQAHP